MAERYMALNGKYLEDADRLLAEGDYAQASEKYWGAVATLLKAIATKRRWRHGGHRELWDVIGRLSRESGGEEIGRLFSVAESLHANFYETWMPPHIVEDHARQAHVLLEKLQPMAA
jgi:hypothetical protein